MQQKSYHLLAIELMFTFNLLLKEAKNCSENTIDALDITRMHDFSIVYL